jgi:hypothetical protein
MIPADRKQRAGVRIFGLALTIGAAAALLGACGESEGQCACGPWGAYSTGGDGHRPHPRLPVGGQGGGGGDGSRSVGGGGSRSVGGSAGAAGSAGSTP